MYDFTEENSFGHMIWRAPGRLRKFARRKLNWSRISRYVYFVLSTVTLSVKSRQRSNDLHLLDVYTIFEIFYSLSKDRTLVSVYNIYTLVSFLFNAGRVELFFT